MKTIEFLLSVLISFSLAACASAQIKRTDTIKQSEAKTKKTNGITSSARPNDKRTAEGALEILAEGANSKIEQPFVFVARSNETYAQLQNLIENLPTASEIDFSKSAIVAAFAGTKNTGGYSVLLKRTMNKISIQTLNPPKDAMLAQVITAPFAVALVPLAENNPLSLAFSSDWNSVVQTYQIARGTFEFSGGFAGKQKTFEVVGAISVLRFGDYATMIFNLFARNSEKARKLTDTASGTLKDDIINLGRLDAGSFSENPKPPLKVAGTMVGNKLSLTFESLPSQIADGFQAHGKILAEKVKQ